MAEVQIRTFRLHITDWNGIERTQTQIVQNWSEKKYGPLNKENLQKFLKAQWPDNVVFHSVKEVVGVVDRDAFTADRTSPAARPRIEGAP